MAATINNHAGFAFAVSHAKHLKAFTQAFSCLAKVGSDVTVEARPTGLYLRALNDSKQAFVQVGFPRDFFSEFALRPGGADESGASASTKQAAPVRCKVSLKCCSFALRRCTPKQVSRLALRYEVSSGGRRDAQLHFELTNRASVRKAYSFIVESTDVLLPSIDERRLVSAFAISASSLLRVVGHISGTDEIVLTATASGLKLASLHDEEVAAHERTQMDNTLTIDSGKLRTSLLISADDFDELTIPSASQLTFCVKELKAVLQYVRSAISREVCRFAFCDGGDPLILHGGSSESTAGGAHSAALNAYASPSDVSVKLVIATAIGANLGAEVESIGNQQRSERERAERLRRRPPPAVTPAAPMRAAAAAGGRRQGNSAAFRPPPPRAAAAAAAHSASRRHDRHDRTDRTDRSEQTEPVDRTERTEPVDRSDRTERTDPLDGGDSTLHLSGDMFSADAARRRQFQPPSIAASGSATPMPSSVQYSAPLEDETDDGFANDGAFDASPMVPLSPFAAIRAAALRNARRSGGGGAGAGAGATVAAKSSTHRDKRARIDPRAPPQQRSPSPPPPPQHEQGEEQAPGFAWSPDGGDGSSQAPVANSDGEEMCEELDWEFPPTQQQQQQRA